MKLASKIDDIPNGWEVKRLGEIGAFSKGKGITKEQLVKSGLPCIRYGEIYTTHGFVIKNFVSFINEEIAKESKRIKKGDILFAGSGETIEEIGKATVYVGEEKAFAGGDVIILSTLDNVNAEFLSYALETDLAKRQKRVLGQGNSVVHVYPSDLAKVKILLPSIDEQNEIVQILNSLGETINKIAQLIRQKELRKKWLMQKLLTGKKRLPGFIGEWKKYDYNDLLQVVKRPVQWNDQELYKLISVRRRSGGLFHRDSLFGHQIKTKDLRTAQTGDFLFSKMQIVHGASGIVTDQFNGMKISGSYIAVISKEPQLLDIKYFNWVSQLPYFYHQTYISSFGVHIEKMTFDFESFLSLGLELPPLKEQVAINNVLAIADKEITLLKYKLAKLKEQKKGLMQVLLTGKKRLV